MLQRISIASLSAISLAWLFSGVAYSADWGYEDQGSSQQEVTPMRAQALPLQKPGAAAPHVVPGKPVAKSGASAAPTSIKSNPIGAAGKSSAAGAPAKTSAVGPFGPRKATTPVSASRLPVTQPVMPGTTGGAKETEALVQECWAQVYSLAAAVPKLEPEQRTHLDSLIDKKLNGTPAQKEDARSVLKYWRSLTTYLVAHPEQKPNYGKLLRALLRWKARNETALPEGQSPDEMASDESNLIAEVLGPQRLSVPGTVPFSEEAVEAYADMACFIYEQQNPGKSVDALDNRAVFATVVAQKFKEAPTKKDQEAMAGFDLSWAKFKIVWTQADDNQRATLLANLKKSGAGAAWAQARDPMLDSVLKNWASGVTVKPQSVASHE